MALKPPIKWVPSPNFGYPDPGAHGRCGQRPLAIVHHLMEGTLTGTDSHFSNPTSQASTGFGIGKSGEIHQYVDSDDAAWGNGGLNKPDVSIPWIVKCVREGISPNLVTISVEYEGRHSDDPSGRYHFTEAQITAGITLDAYLCEKYAIAPSRETICGHFQLDSVTRAFCPGPNFPFDRFIKALQPPAPQPAPDAWKEQYITQLIAGGLLTDRRPAGQPVQFWELAAVSLKILDRIKALEAKLGAPAK